MDDSELLEAQAELFGSVFVLTQHLARLTDTTLEPFGLTTRQWLLLAVLVRGFPGRDPSLTEAAERHGSSRQNVKQIALGLQARGFLELTSDPLDGRATRLHLTERVAMFDQPGPAETARALLANAHAGLTPAETATLRDLILRWLAGVSALPPAAIPGSPRSAPATTRTEEP